MVSQPPGSSEVRVPGKPQLKTGPCPPCQRLTSAFSCSQITAYLLVLQSKLSTLLFSCGDRDKREVKEALGQHVTLS